MKPRIPRKQKKMFKKLYGLGKLHRLTIAMLSRDFKVIVPFKNNIDKEK